MKKASLSLIWFAALSACFVLLTGCATTDARLQGKWKSNRELTVQTLNPTKPLSKAKRAKLEELFGKMTVTYARGKVMIELPEEGDQPASRSIHSYKVTNAQEDSLTLITFDSPTGPQQTNLINFDGPNRYWTQLGDSGAKEYFDRVERTAE